MRTFRSDKIQSFKLSKSTSTAVFAATAKNSPRHFARSNSVQESSESPSNIRGLKIQLPTLDQGIDNFFTNADKIQQEASPTSVDITDFDIIKVDSAILSKRKITQGPKRRRPATAMRVLAQLRTDTITEYTELVQCDSPSPNDYMDMKKSKFTAEALAGLAATEDFTAISLKSTSEPLNVTHLPYKLPMLIHIKGRRHVQCRLVPLKFSSLNEGDCFVLITSDKLFSFVGRYANVIEMKVCKDMCASILRDKDLGCGAAMVLSVTRDNLDGHNGKMFSKILNREEDEEEMISAGHSEEDELIENCLQETNMVYEFMDDSFVPVEEFWGQVMTISLVNSRKILLFDFGSEVYVWNGKNALPDDKKMALMLAEEFFETPYDYTSCDLNPINFSSLCGHRKSLRVEKMKGVRRPDWSFLARINQNMETILFRQKFADWPDIKIKMKNGFHHVDCNEIEHVNGERLLRNWSFEEPNLVLENSCLGRGNFYFDNETRRYFEIITVGAKKWHADAEGNQELSTDLHPHFYANEAYTALWKYQISITVRELSGKVSTRSTVGRDRYVYYNWQGIDATASEKGTSTLHMVELDKEKGSQMIIQQFSEIPAFVRLFKMMFIHKRREDESRYDRWRMYLITGGANDTNEAIAMEVPCEMRQLRSRACIFLVQGRNGQLVLWKGSKTSEMQQKIALSVCSKLCGKKYPEFFATEKIRLREYVEGHESSEFFDAICGDKSSRLTYHSLMERTEAFDFTPRMYELTSKNGSFEAIEVVSGMRSADHYTAFPFVQLDLYNARQPTLFLIDNGHVLYLWQGWWPKNPIEETTASQDEVDVNNIENRAGENRWHLERCEAMQTSIDYWKAKCGHNDKYRRDAYIVTAGYEPIEFQTIFPEWTVRDDVIEMNSQVCNVFLTFKNINFQFYHSRIHQKTKCTSMNISHDFIELNIL